MKNAANPFWVWWWYPLGPHGKYIVRSVCVKWERTGGSAKSVVFVYLFFCVEAFDRVFAVVSRESSFLVAYVQNLSSFRSKYWEMLFSEGCFLRFQRLLFEMTANFSILLCCAHNNAECNLPRVASWDESKRRIFLFFATPKIIQNVSFKGLFSLIWSYWQNGLFSVRKAFRALQIVCKM